MGTTDATMTAMRGLLMMFLFAALAQSMDVAGDSVVQLDMGEEVQLGAADDESGNGMLGAAADESDDGMLGAADDESDDGMLGDDKTILEGVTLYRMSFSED